MIKTKQTFSNIVHFTMWFYANLCLQILKTKHPFKVQKSDCPKVYFKLYTYYDPTIFYFIYLINDVKKSYDLNNEYNPILHCNQKSTTSNLVYVKPTQSSISKVFIFFLSHA